MGGPTQSCSKRSAAVSCSGQGGDWIMPGFDPSHLPPPSGDAPSLVYGGVVPCPAPAKGDCDSWSMSDNVTSSSALSSSLRSHRALKFVNAASHSMLGPVAVKTTMY